VIYQRKLIDPREISTQTIPHPRAINKMKEVLTKQGQIEPLQVKVVGYKLKTHVEDAWGDEIVFAAIELGWSHIDIIINTRYEQ
jgi:hypothetical protein